MKSIIPKLILLCFMVACRGENSSTETVSVEMQTVSHATSIEEPECEIPMEHHQKNPYTGQGSYSIGFCDEQIVVQLTLNLVGDPVSDETRAIYKEEIESRWSTDRFEVPIVFKVVWSDIDPDKTITVINGWGNNWHTSRWYSRGRMDAVAHEAGHYIGLFDEYGGGDAQGFDGGSSNGDRPWHPPGMMHTSWREPLDYYYDHFLLWFWGI